MNVTSTSTPYAAAAPRAESSGGAADSSAEDIFGARADTQTFLQLLVAQIRSQDPLNPQDPTAFVSQLAEFSSLEQLIEMRKSLESLEGLASAPPPTEA